MKLKLEHLAPYLPYKLKGKWNDSNEFWQLDCTILETNYTENKNPIYSFLGDPSCKPILRPLSDLKKEIEIGSKKFIPVDEIYRLTPNTPNFREILEPANVWDLYSKDLSKSFIEWCVVKTLFEWHFDVFGLIEKGLAIDINSLNR